MGRIIAVDYGMQRTGMAWTDPLRISINPLPTVLTAQFEHTLRSLIEKEEVDTVVFGLSVHSDGTLTSVARKVKKVIDALRREFAQITFDLVDESFSSVEAKKLLKNLGVKKMQRSKKDQTDQYSALIILREYLESGQ